MDFDSLRKAQRDLRERYQKGKGLVSDAHRTVYHHVRKPATTAVLRHLLGHLSIGTLLDLGAGQGASLDALTFEKAILIEKDPKLVGPSTETVTYLNQDFTKLKEFPSCDLLLASYSFNEVDYAPLLPKCVAATRDLIVIIEPGTPEGSLRILAIREALLNLGMHLVAPCPHSKACPMPWCHFSVRLPRTEEHRKIKGASFGHEDEKFAYLIFSKKPHQPLGDRIVRHPQKRTGHVIFTLCTEEGELKEKVISKKNASYKTLKKMDWGDELNMV
ncbi:MAG: hypothetical protein KBC64_03110 [Simkaniaceae bacterium]|nr:hypothetical protein [Simkaniaceae bacterium]